MKYYVLALVACAIADCSIHREVSGQDIIAQYFERIGGEEAIEQVEAQRARGFFEAEGTGTEPWTLRGTFEELRLVEPYRLSAYYYADTLHALLRAKDSRLNSPPGMSVFSMMVQDQTHRTPPIPFSHLLDARIVEGATSSDRYIVELVDADSVDWTVTFDAKTHLPQRAVTTYSIPFLRRGCEVEYTYDDFRSTSGVLLPHRIEKSACDLGKVTSYITSYDNTPKFDKERFTAQGYKSQLVDLPLHRKGGGNVTTSAEGPVRGGYSREIDDAYKNLVNEVKLRMARGRSKQSELVGTAFPLSGAKKVGGGALSSDDLLGKVTLVDFWATWCGNCIEALPGLADFKRTAPADRFQVLGVSVDDDIEVVKEFLQGRPEVDWEQVWDEEAKIWTAVGGMAVPTYFVLDAEGMIREVYLGTSPEMFESIRELISDM